METRRAQALAYPPEVREHVGSPTPIAIGHRDRLDPSTFEDVQRTIRVWADAVERYPDAFSRLSEDRLSDLLAATLNASLPGAQREVYSRGGKSDIFIRANILDEGRAPAKVFIAESKWWKGPRYATDALDQLLSYLEVKDTSAVLLFFVRNTKPSTVRPSAAQVFEERTDFDRSYPSAVEGWPLYSFVPRDAKVTVCVALIDLPPRRRLSLRRSNR